MSESALLLDSLFNIKKHGRVARFCSSSGQPVSEYDQLSIRESILRDGLAQDVDGSLFLTAAGKRQLSRGKRETK